MPNTRVDLIASAHDGAMENNVIASLGGPESMQAEVGAKNKGGELRTDFAARDLLREDGLRGGSGRGR
jgi:hypothetical protein